MSEDIVQQGLACDTCGHIKISDQDGDGHQDGSGKCNHEGCDCQAYVQAQIPLPMNPRDDLDLAYRIAQGEIISFACKKCGHFESGEWLGIDLAKVKGIDFSIDVHYITKCNACGTKYLVKELMDEELLRTGWWQPEHMKKSKGWPLKWILKMPEDKMTQQRIHVDVKGDDGHSTSEEAIRKPE